MLFDGCLDMSPLSSPPRLKLRYFSETIVIIIGRTVFSARVKIRISMRKILTCEREEELKRFSIQSIHTRGKHCAPDYNN